MNKRKLGKTKEQIAAMYIRSKGCDILTCNYNCKYGEIDIIYHDCDYLVFGEVKYRKTDNFGYPIESISYIKQKRLSFTAMFYMTKNKVLQNTPIRFDVICILGNKIKVYKNAFEPICF